MQDATEFTDDPEEFICAFISRFDLLFASFASLRQKFINYSLPSNRSTAARVSGLNQSYSPSTL